MLGIVSINKILHNATTLKDSDQLSVGERIRKSRNSSIGIDFEEPGFFLRVLCEADLGMLVG